VRLLENAAKYACLGCTLGAYIERWFAHIAIQDNGRGFPPDKLDKVFDLFERGEAESTVPVWDWVWRFVAHRGARWGDTCCQPRWRMRDLYCAAGWPPIIETEQEDE
jgi:two-component system sensor histidine kinase KdpD